MIIGLFDGIAGWGEGFRAAGYTGRILGLELDLDAGATARAAGHESNIFDLSAMTPPSGERPDGITASPPCQSFSKAGNRQGLDDPRGELVWVPLRWVEALRPRWVALEQVPDVLPIWRLYQRDLGEWGYSTFTGKLSTEQYGVPQTRERAILIARRDGVVAAPPPPTHQRWRGADAEPVTLFGDRGLKPWVSMGEALDLGGALAMPQWVFDRPATTVTTEARLGAPGHHDENNRQFDTDNGAVPITLEQALVLQGFRADYPVQGATKDSRSRQVGNAIPPPLARAIVETVLAPSPTRG